MALPVQQAPAVHVRQAACTAAGAFKQGVLSGAKLPANAAVRGLCCCGWRRAQCRCLAAAAAATKALSLCAMEVVETQDI